MIWKLLTLIELFLMLLFLYTKKTSGKYNREITQREYEKRKNDCFVFKGTDRINDRLDHVLQFKGEAKNSIKIVEYNLYKLAHNGSGFDSYVVINNLPQWRTVVSLIKNGSGVLSLRIFNDYVDQNKKIPQYVHFRCGRVHIINSLKKTSVTCKLQSCLLEQESEYDEIYEGNWEEKK